MQSSQNHPENTNTRPQESAQAVDSGVPLIEATARDFIQVRATLVRRFGNADDALVWTRIYWRTDSQHRETYTFEGHEWWAPGRDQLANETGLKESQVRRALERLQKGGYILGEQHRRGGPYDRQKSYTCVIAERAILPEGKGAAADSEKAESPDVEAAILPDVPSTETPLRGETSTLLVPGQVDVEDFLGGLFDAMWQAWPRTEAKATARKAFAKAVMKTRGDGVYRERRAEMISGAACAWAQGACARRDAGQFMPLPYLATWLNQERWEEDPPKLDPVAPAGFDRDQPTQRVQAALDLGAQMDAQYDLAHQTETRRGAISR